jgi:hypothetical protein
VQYISEALVCIKDCHANVLGEGFIRKPLSKRAGRLVHEEFSLEGVQELTELFHSIETGQNHKSFTKTFSVKVRVIGFTGK